MIVNNYDTAGWEVSEISCLCVSLPKIMIITVAMSLTNFLSQHTANLVIFVASRVNIVVKPDNIAVRRVNIMARNHWLQC